MTKGLVIVLMCAVPVLAFAVLMPTGADSNQPQLLSASEVDASVQLAMTSPSVQQDPLALDNWSYTRFRLADLQGGEQEALGGLFGLGFLALIFGSIHKSPVFGGGGFLGGILNFLGGLFRFNI